MGTEHSARKYDLFDAAEMANPLATVKNLSSSPKGFDITWEWDGKEFNHFIPPEDMGEVEALAHLFRCAIEMAKM